MVPTPFLTPPPPSPPDITMRPVRQRRAHSMRDPVSDADTRGRLVLRRMRTEALGRGAVHPSAEARPDAGEERTAQSTSRTSRLPRHQPRQYTTGRWRSRSCAQGEGRRGAFLRISKRDGRIAKKINFLSFITKKI